MNRIAELRKEKKLNQTKLAMCLNVSQYTISAIETERQQLTSDMLITLADFFGVSVDYILGRSDIKYRADDMRTDVLTQNEIKMLDIFKNLTEGKQNQAIGVVFALKNLK